MPLTKLARRFHENKENVFATPSRNVVPLNETTEIPPYVTVRKKKISKPLNLPEFAESKEKCFFKSTKPETQKTGKDNEENIKPDLCNFTLNSTIINGQRHAVSNCISDCQDNFRHESTHIDHIFEKFGKLNLSAFTEDISAIYEPDESFKTAVDDPKKIVDLPPRVLAEDSNEEIHTTPLRSDSEVNVSSRIVQWVISSPFQSPAISAGTIVISDSEDEVGSDEESEVETTDNLLKESVTTASPTQVDEGSSRLQEESFVGQEEFDCSVTSKQNPICNDDIADVWCLEEESNGVVDAPAIEKSTADKGLQVTIHEISKRSVCLQVSLDDPDISLESTILSDNEVDGRNRIPSSSTSESAAESADVGDQIGEEVRNTLSLVDDVNSEGNALYLEDSCEPEELSFLTSLSLDTPTKNCHKEAIKYIRNFKKHRDQLVAKLFQMFNRDAFQSALPLDLQFAWNPRRTKTAGVCINRKIRIDNEREERLSKIELSSKVVDNPERLCKTLLHELCHAAAWIKCGVRDGHGFFFRYFAQEAMKGTYF